MKRAGTPKIDIVPLVDVLMVLIVFFLMTMQFQDLRALNVKLPKIKTAGSNLIQGQLVVGIKSSGEYELNGNASNVTEIQTIMESIADAQKDTQILIAADEDVPLKFLTAIVDLCRQSGLENFRLQSR